MYTLSKGVFAESGRLRHKDDALEDECGLEIVGLEDQDNGQWECEVGSLIGDTFQTASANINLNVKSKDWYISKFMPFHIRPERPKIVHRPKLSFLEKPTK